MPRHN
jgi:RNA recognition motif-containing protein